MTGLLTFPAIPEAARGLCRLLSCSLDNGAAISRLFASDFKYCVNTESSEEGVVDILRLSAGSVLDGTDDCPPELFSASDSRLGLGGLDRALEGNRLRPAVIDARDFVGLERGAGRSRRRSGSSWISFLGSSLAGGSLSVAEALLSFAGGSGVMEMAGVSAFSVSFLMSSDILAST